MKDSEKHRLKHLIASSNEIVGRDKIRIMQCIEEFEKWIPVTESLPEVTHWKKLPKKPETDERD